MLVTEIDETIKLTKLNGQNSSYKYMSFVQIVRFDQQTSWNTSTKDMNQI